MKKNELNYLPISKLFFTSIILFLVSNIGTSFGQTFSGKVLDKDSLDPIENVNIFLTKNSRNGTASNKKGEFILKIQHKIQKKDSIAFSSVGYKTYTTTIASLKENNNRILLSKENNYLKEVSLKGKRKQSRIKFKKIASLKSRLFSPASVIVGSKIYISGGDKSVTDDSFKRVTDKVNKKYLDPSFAAIMSEWYPSQSFKAYNDKLIIYDIEKNVFEISNIKIENRAYHQMKIYKDDIYILGGKKLEKFNGTEYLHNKIEVINLKKATVKVDRTNPHQAVNFCSFLYKDNIVTMGGSVKINKDGTKKYTDKIHLYNLPTGLWYELGKMNEPKEVVGINIDEKFFTISGSDNQSFSKIESWNINTGKWSFEGNLFFNLNKPALTKNKNNIYIYDNGNLLIYNVLNKVLKQYTINLYLKNSKMHFYKDKLYIIGGYKETEYSKEPSSGIYKIDISEFNKTKVINSKKF